MKSKKQIRLAHVFLSLGIVIFLQCAQQTVPPTAKKIPKQLTIHGDTRTDNYFWLRERDNPEVINYLKAENKYLEQVMKPHKKLMQHIYDEMVGRIKQDDDTVPYLENGYYYYRHYEEGKEFPIYMRKKGSLEAADEVILDVNQLAKGHDYFYVNSVNVSDDNRFVSFGVDTVSRRQYTIHFKNLETGEMLTDSIPNTLGSSCWANDNKTVFYAVKDSTLRPFKIMRHVLGTNVADDAEIFIETDNTFDAFVFKSKSRKYIFIASYSTLSTEYRFIDADRPLDAFKTIQTRQKDLEYSVSHYNEKFYILTNDQANNFRLMETDVRHTQKRYWKEVIPHRADVLLEDVEIFKDELVLQERKDGLTQLRIINQTTGNDRYVDFGEQVYVANPVNNYEFDTEWLRYSYSSLTTPNSVYDYNMTTGEKKLLKEEEVLGGFDRNNYQAERLFATVNDSVKIPISLVYRKGLVKDGTNPLLLYGYGSYGYSIDPDFSSSRLSLHDRGFVYAIAHIRGGQVMGRQWYEDGKLLNKKNTFTDFIDCAEYLIDQKYTNPNKLFAAGGSAGGLLIGAVVNMRPDLFKAVIAAVPWVDVVTTMLDESIPLTTGEYDEWGNPNKKEYYDYMLSYSPYDNVKAQAYPAMLVTTGLHDSQVQYWEPAKWVAKLRAMKTDNHLLLLHTQMEAGHSGKAGRFERYKETALEYTFLLDQAGIKK
ncbi:S9 family peptidase [candidate division KSB1 bacterium]|nr:S9 family peptidase [candidate division KSB1 bacterium]